MKCPRCQHENPQGARFCEECATALARTCSNCGTALSATAKFCHACAHPVSGGAGTPSRSPESYTPKHLAERILTSKAALEGERKQVTVLFADLKGSMELLADRDPEEARKLLDPVLTLMMDAVHRYEGTVNQVMGDGIMALFGAPLAHEDHAVRACYAALRMQESVKTYAEDVRRSEGIPIQIRVGLNSGDVVVRSIGTDLRMDYTAVGQTAHLAARMEQIAMPGTSLLTAQTLRLAEDYIEVKVVGPVAIKGLERPVQVYEMIGTGVARTRLEAAARRGLSRFVGRDAEMAQLRGAIEKAGRGQGQVVAVVGEPGVGKSRLFHEFVHSHRTHGWRVVQSRSVSYGKATPYLPIVDLLKDYFRIQNHDEHREIRERVTGKVLTLEEALRPLLPALLALLDLPVEDHAWQALDPSQRRRETHDAVRQLLLRESQVQPLCLVVEDLHWIDAETQAILDGLVDSLPGTRILLLVNYRPEYHHGWGSKTYYGQARIDPLPEASATELLDALLGVDASLDLLKPLMIARTEGNPFFLEESVRMLVETGVLAGDPGRYQLARPLASIQVPATVQTVLAARIDRLSAAAKSLLQSASVIGKDVPVALLRTIVGLPEATMREQLSYLQAGEFLYETRLFPDLEYTFKHALTHEVAYGSLLQERRQALHARIVDALDHLYPSRAAEHVERLAHHALRGELWERAAAYLPQAGAKAVGRGANREAAAFFDEALVALAHLPQDQARVEQAIDLRLELRNTVLVPLEFDRALRYLREAEALARTRGDQQRLARISAHKTHSLWLVGEYEQAIAAGHEALGIAHTIGDFATHVAATQYLGQVLRTMGLYPEAVALFRQTIASVQGESKAERFGMHALPAVLARVFLADCLTSLGEFGEALTQARDATEIADDAGHPFSIVAALAAFGFLFIRKGDPDNTLPHVERGAALARAWNIRVWSPVFLAALGLANTLAGRLAEAMPTLEEGRKEVIARVTNNNAILPDLSLAFFLAGRREQAAELAGLAIAQSRDGKQKAVHTLTLYVLSEMASARGPGEAVRNYEQALKQAGELGMRPLVAHCHLGLGKLYGRTDKREQAQEHLITATTMYREMGMTYWLQKAEAEMKKL